MKWLIFILLIPTAKADALLDAIYVNWNNSYLYGNSNSVSEIHSTENYLDNYPETPDSSEPEFYSWNLGTPDNLPETIIIYEDTRCWCE